MVDALSAQPPARAADAPPEVRALAERISR
jgi:hypothetical protein